MKAWKDIMIARVRRTWEEQYRGNAQPTKSRKEPDFLDSYLNQHQEQLSGDEFDCYMFDTPVRLVHHTDYDLLNWWRNEGPEQLRQQAYDLLSIPAMSAEVERVFSSAKRTITADRNRLNDETIELLELLRYWWTRGIAVQIRR
jgi:hypothetical protein